MAERGVGWRIAQRLTWTVILLLSSVTVFRVVRFIWRNPWLRDDPTLSPRVFEAATANNALLFAHVCTALPCLVLGPFLLLPWFRTRFLSLHRKMGKVYVVGVLVSAVIGFALATGNSHGDVAKAGFMSLGVTWFTTTLFAYRTIRAGDLAGHRRWMIRSYAISLAVVTVRFIGPPPPGMTVAEWYPIMTWVCWVPQLMLAEIYVRVTDAKGRLAVSRIH